VEINSLQDFVLLITQRCYPTEMSNSGACPRHCHISN